MRISDTDTIVIIGAHPDDIEFGCGALISKLKNKDRIVCVTLSPMKHLKNNEDLLHQQNKSLDFLGIDKNNRYLGDFECRRFHRDRQMICDFLWKINEEYKPQIVMSHPTFSDMHQDHEVVSRETLRIFRNTSILGYQNQPRYYYRYYPNLFVQVEEKDVNNKMKALSFYKYYNNKEYFSKDLIRSQLRSNGIYIDGEYAEAYHTMRIYIR